MDAVAKRERSVGRETTDVSAECCGYDIESRDPETGRLRFLIVKERGPGARTVAVTRNERLAALNAGEACTLALALTHRGSKRRVIRAENPARIFGAAPLRGVAPDRDPCDRGRSTVRDGLTGGRDRGSEPP